ncbi:MAG: hypothetical protein ACPGVG_13065 [Mycobacterium sp.]
MTRVLAEIDDGKLTIDLKDALSHATAKAGVQLALDLSLIDAVFENVADQMIDGFTDPTREGYSHVPDETIQKARLRLLESVDTIRDEAIRGLRDSLARVTEQRDTALTRLMELSSPRDRAF